MKEFRMFETVWLSGELFHYLGWGEDGEINFCRPLKSSAFPITEFNTLYPADEEEEYEQFLNDNGQTFTESCKRRGIKIPEGE